MKREPTYGAWLRTLEARTDIRSLAPDATSPQTMWKSSIRSQAPYVEAPYVGYGPLTSATGRNVRSNRSTNSRKSTNFDDATS